MNILTIIVLLYLAGMTAFAAKRGFFRSIFSMAFLLVVVLIMIVLTPAVTNVFRHSEYVTEYVNRQSAAVIASQGYGDAGVMDISNAHSPAEVAQAVIAMAMRTTSVTDQGAETIAAVIINTIAAAATFLIALIAAILVRMIIGKMIRRSGAGPLDHLLGVPVGL